jgi:hypothetical protein
MKLLKEFEMFLYELIIDINGEIEDNKCIDDYIINYPLYNKNSIEINKDIECEVDNKIK